MMRKHIQKSLSRKAQHREQVLAEEQTVDVEAEAADPFFAQDEEQTSAPFQAQLTAEDVEEMEEEEDRPRGWKRPREDYSPQRESRRTHMRFQD